MTTRKAASWISRLLANAAFPLLVAYVVLLLGTTYFSQQNLRDAADKELWLELEKQAAALSYFFSERRSDIENLTQDRSLAVHFSNQALGMSMEYGLRASMLMMQKRFQEVVSSKKIAADPIYQRLLFVGCDGEVLIDVGTMKGAPAPWIDEVLTGADPSEVRLHPIKEKGSLLFFVEHRYKGAVTGVIIAELDRKLIIEQLLHHRHGDGSQLSILAGSDSFYNLSNHDADVRQDLGEIATDPYQQQSQLFIPIPETPLVLGLFGSPDYSPGYLTSRWYLVSLTVLAILILLWAAIGARTRSRNLALNARIEESKRQSNLLHEKNQALIDENRKRQEYESKLVESRTIFKTVMDSLPAIVYVADMESYEILFMNEYAKSIYGDKIGGVCWKELHDGQCGPCDFCTSDRLLDPDGRPNGTYIWEQQSARTGDWLECMDQAIHWHDGRTARMEVATIINDRKEYQGNLTHLAHHDPLTDLPNRLLLTDRLDQLVQHARRNKLIFAVIFLDLDRFKNINDSLGHTVGDELLRQVSYRLSMLIRSEDTLARISGDEFVILLEDIHTIDGALVVVEKLARSFSQPFQLAGREIRVTSSLGVSLYPDDGGDAATLLRNADSAMYRAKDEGRNTYQFYTDELTRLAVQRMLIENALRGALDRDEFYLVYQPQVRLENGQLIGVEALLRWDNSELGSVPPTTFIPLSEQNGLINEVGAWVLRTACRQAVDWLDAGVGLEHVAVNVSGNQMQRFDFEKEVKNILEETGLPPDKLELEVTEGCIMQNLEQAINQISALRDHGVSFAVDDFGTGYSSMNYLKRLPISKLKIDQSFVRDIPADKDDMVIAEAIIGLGKSLGLNVVAEGVESRQQAAFLTEKGCDEAQGYLFGKPCRRISIE